MRVFYRILTIIIAVCIPVVSIISAFNIVFRLPDLYVYEFNNKEIADEIDLGIKDEELGQFFSDFMKGKEKNFDLFTEYRDREQGVFSTDEQINMENARKLLNYSLLLLGGAAFLAMICYGIFLLKKKKYELRIAFKTGVFTFAVLQAVMHIGFNIPSIRMFFYNLIFINPFGADDVLPLMLTQQFARLSLFAGSVLSLIIIVVLASITWRMTKPRRMFW